MRSSVLAAALALPAFSQTFTFPNFDDSRRLSFVEDARAQGGVLRVAPARNDRSGAVWFREPLAVTRGFSTRFTFRLTDQDRTSFRGADGLAFVIQNESATAIGGRGHASGFMLGADGNPEVRGIPRSLAVFFDTYQNGEQQDPSGNYAAICTNGDGYWQPRRLLVADRLAVKLEDGRVHAVTVEYQPPRLTVHLDDREILVAAIDMASVAGPDGRAYVGFTAATGGGYQNHDVLSWTFGPATAVDSSMVTSTISFGRFACLAKHTLCTPDKAIVEDVDGSRFRVILPANAAWGASVPNPGGLPLRIEKAAGLVCWDPSLGNAACNGPEGSAAKTGERLVGNAAAASLVMANRDGRTYFSVNDRKAGDNEGFFEFEVVFDSPYSR